MRAYGGRVIFDHLPKTAGTTIHTWFQTEFGVGCVTPKLICDHRELIERYGGKYSILFAHTAFRGEGLDPRYVYLTCLREPLDRAISWIYFVLENHDRSDLPQLYDAAQAFVESEGEVVEPILLVHLKNPYVEHFSKIMAISTEDDNVKLGYAFEGIQQYDFIGCFEDIDQTFGSIKEVIGVSGSTFAGIVGATKKRPKTTEISTTLRDNIRALTELDFEFYNTLKKGGFSGASERRFERCEAWHGHFARNYSHPIFSKIEVVVSKSTLMRGEILKLSLIFQITEEIGNLEIGLHVHDEVRRCVFGTNTTLLETRCENVRPGYHRADFYLNADLAPGNYTAGFSATSLMSPSVQSANLLAWYDPALTFHVQEVGRADSIGYADLVVAYNITQVSKLS